MEQKVIAFGLVRGMLTAAKEAMLLPVALSGFQATLDGLDSIHCKQSSTVGAKSRNAEVSFIAFCAYSEST